MNTAIDSRFIIKTYEHGIIYDSIQEPHKVYSLLNRFLSENSSSSRVISKGLKNGYINQVTIVPKKGTTDRATTTTDQTSQQAAQRVTTPDSSTAPRSTGISSDNTGSTIDSARSKTNTTEIGTTNRLIASYTKRPGSNAGPNRINIMNQAPSIEKNMFMSEGTYADEPQYNMKHFAGMELPPDTQNSWATAANSKESQSDKISRFLQDCIPCQFRIIDLSQLNPLADLLNSLLDELMRRLNELLSLLDLLTNRNFMMDLCNLLDFLNFMCVPDLVLIIMMILSMLKMLAFDLDSLKDILLGLLGDLLGDILLNLGTLIDQLIDMIVQPIVCIIDSLKEQVEKLDVQKAIKLGLMDLGSSSGGTAKLFGIGPTQQEIANSLDRSNEPTVVEDFTKELDKIKQTILNAENGVIGVLYQTLGEGKQMLEDALNTPLRALKALFGDKGDYDKALLSYIDAIIKLGYIISIAEAILKNKLLKPCDNKKDELEQSIQSVKDVLDRNSDFEDFSIVLSENDRGLLTLSQKSSAFLEPSSNVINLWETPSLQRFKTYMVGNSATPTVPTYNETPELLKRTQEDYVSRSVTIDFSNCSGKIEGVDQETVDKWKEELDASE